MQALIDFLAQHPALALVAVFAAALLEAIAVIGTVVPGSSVVFAAGILVGLGVVEPAWAAASAVSGAILGDGISFWLGRRYREQLRGMWPMRSLGALLERGQAFFAQHGAMSVFMARFLGPVRAIVPMVAGMSSMSRTRFTSVNVISAIAWAAAHLLPGVVFGASLQLAGAVSSRLAILMAGVATAIWASVLAIRLIHRCARSFFLSWRDRTVAWAQKGFGFRSRVILSLLDPERPESAALLTAAVVLLGSAWAFLAILEDLISNDPMVGFDHIAFESLQNLRTSWVDAPMIVVTELGGVRVAIPVIAAVGLVLGMRRRWRTLGYWVSAVAFAQALVWILKSTLDRPRPIAMYDAVEQFSFPSGHAATSVVLYGFLAVLLARGRPPAVKWAVALTAVLLIGFVSFSRLYLGAHWLSDVLGSITLGMAWVALLSIAYLQHAQSENVPSAALAGVSLVTLLVAGGAAVATQYAADLVRYAPRSAATLTLLSDWQATGWRELPAHRTDVDGDHEEPLTVQWVGASNVIEADLQAGGWHRPPPWNLRTTASWLLPSTAIDLLPVLEKFHRGAQAALTFERLLSPSQRLVLRLWPSGHVVDIGGQKPSALWIGVVTLECVRHPFNAVTLVSTEPDFADALARFTASLQAQNQSWRIEQRDGGPVDLIH